MAGADGDRQPMVRATVGGADHRTIVRAEDAPYYAPWAVRIRMIPLQLLKRTNLLRRADSEKN